MADAKPRYLQSTIPHRVAGHFLIHMCDLSACVKEKKAGLALVPIASVFASRALAIWSPEGHAQVVPPVARCHAVPGTNLS